MPRRQFGRDGALDEVAEEAADEVLRVSAVPIRQPKRAVGEKIHMPPIDGARQ